MDVGALSLVLAGKRVPSYPMARKMAESLALTPEEQEQFLYSVAGEHKNRGCRRLNPMLRSLHKQTPSATGPARELSLDLFRVIADWYHYAILELTYTDSFRPSPQWIASELGISETQAKLGIDRLFRLGLIKKTGSTFIKSDQHLTTADKHVTSGALRQGQKQILENAIFSVENDPIEERSNTHMVMAIDPEKLPEAKKMILEFNRKLCAFLESGKRKRVYTLGIALNPNQRRKKKE